MLKREGGSISGIETAFSSRLFVFPKACDDRLVESAELYQGNHGSNDSTDFENRQREND